MKLTKNIFIFLFIFSSSLFAQNKDIDNLLEKVNQEKSIEKKQELIEELKQKLATSNKKSQEKADAIIKAKKKIPLSIYSDSK